MTKAEVKSAEALMDQRIEKMKRDIVKVREFGVYAGQDGWNSPPAVIPRAAELAMGIYYDPEKNTR